MARTKNIADAIRSKLDADPDLADAVARERFNANVASVIFAMREAAGLTQKELAQRIGTHQSVIARLEGADYDSHSLRMLQRIADALGKRVEISFVDQTRPKRARSAAPVKR
ncbi:MAG TPA: helix-turn-helix transcriptional regulator [Pirellulales bacterium]|jgi:ribosome-binding protein aMBF1 (putative translation factor)|nr:helix-turn-helix transcriptional regulator [Pirellulales bacterium]